MSIHPSAIIDPTAQLGVDVEIGPYAVIGAESRIGDRCRIFSHAVIEYTTLGEECQVFPHACIGLAPQHLRYAGEKTRVEVGKKTTFREGVTVHRGTPFDASVTTVGDNGYFMALSHIAHDCRIGNNVTMANGAVVAGHCSIGDNVFISGLAAFHQFVRVGRGALVSGGAMVSLDVAPFCIAQGDRAVLKGLNVIGMRRSGIPRASMQLVKRAFTTAFQSGLLLAEAINTPDLTIADPYVEEFRKFLSVPKRGFVRPSGTGVAEEEVAL